MNILFELCNCDSALEVYAPIVESLRLRSRNTVCSVVDLCEFFGLQTDIEALQSILDEVHTIDSVRLTGAPHLPGLASRFNLLPASLDRLWRVRRRLGEIVRKTDPRVVVVANDRRFPEHDVVILANRAKVPTLLLQESIRKDLKFPSKYHGKRAALVRRFFAYEQGQLRHGEGGVLKKLIARGDKWDMVFFDSGELASLIEWGKLKDRIAIGGIAAFHDIFFPKSFKNFIVCASIVADPSWKVLFVDDSTMQGLMIAQRQA